MQHKLKAWLPLAVILLTALNLSLYPVISRADQNNDIALLAKTAKGFAAIVKQAEPGVVHIRVEKNIGGKMSRKGQGLNPFDLFNDPFFQQFFGHQFRHPGGGPFRHPRSFKQRAAGSGFIISDDGYILTNNHVVGDADKITVRLADEREFQAKVIGTDPQSDVAVIKIDAAGLPTLPLGDSDKLEVGEWVIAIGSPFELSQTVTVGVVSAKGRNRMGINDYENFIQTDAAINPGNSGGPLLNIHGQVIGINTAIFTRSGGYMGIGFAIPINMAKAIEKQLVKTGKVVRGWLGVVIQDVDEDLAKSFGLEKAGGVLISEVQEKSPAARAGLKEGDVITKLNDHLVENVADLRNRVALTAPGTQVKLSLIRDGKQKTINVTIGEQPADFATLARSHGAATPLGKLGLTLQNLTPDLAEQFGYKKNQGVLITEVAPDSPAAEVGLQSGQLIEEVNKIRVHNLRELKKALKRAKHKKRVLLRIRSGEFSQYVVIRFQ